MVHFLVEGGRGGCVLDMGAEKMMEKEIENVSQELIGILPSMAV